MSGVGESMVLGMCTFNRGPRIERTLEAIARMDRVGNRVTRLVIIDNNSTDQTAEVIDRFAAGCSRLAISRILETRQGQSFARERLATETTEPIIAFLDDDVIPDESWARMVLDVFDRRSPAAIVGGRVDLEWETGPTPQAQALARMLAMQDWGEHEHRLDNAKDYLVGAAFGIRRDALVRSRWLTHRLLGGRAGGGLGSGDDYEIGMRVRSIGGELWYTPQARCTHLIPPSRQTPEYLNRLISGVSRSEPFVRWLEAGEPGPEWVMAMRSRAGRKLLRTQLLEWRPKRRARRLLERTSRLAGWNDLLKFLQSTQRT